MAQPRSAVDYRFAGFVLRPKERTLTSDRGLAAVGPRAFDVLVALVERAGGLVTKDELFERVWPNLIVEENNLQVQVSALRKVVGHEAIATVPGHGYRFTLPVEAVDQNDGGATHAWPRGLPRPPTSFIGRAAELRECVELLDKCRLLTLAGVGGIGKTRLAIELAAAAGDRFPDGVAFVELAPIGDPSAVLDAVGLALGVVQDPSRSPRDALLAHVTARRQLIVLDNCEHLLQPCAELVAHILRSGTGSKLVATTREPLHVAGEVVYQVPALAVPNADASYEAEPEKVRDCAAVTLFVDRASAIDREFAITRKNAVDVALICRGLDGIPLALELAASRLRSMSAHAIAGHLAERFRLLVEGDRSVPRHQTLRAMLDWSYELLTDAERSLLRRLSVFAGGFEVDAAEEVGAGDDVRKDDVLYVLVELVDKSLVAFDSRRERYHLLETVRQYALERLVEAGEETAVRDRHVGFHAALGKRMSAEIRGPRQPELIARILVERDNIWSAFAHAGVAAHGGPAGLVMVHGLLLALSHQSLELSLRTAVGALAHPGAQADSVARCHALHATSSMHLSSGYHDEALGEAEESVRIGRECGDAAALAEALMRLGQANIALGRAVAAREDFLEGLGLALQCGSRLLSADAHSGLAELCSVDRSELELAQRHYHEALAGYAREPDALATTYMNLARNAVELGTQQAAIQYARDGLAAGRFNPPHSRTQSLLCVCGGIALLRRQPAVTVRLFGAAAAGRERTGYRNFEPDRTIFDGWHKRAREAMEATAAAEAFAAGAALDDDAAWAEAIGWLENLSPERS